MPLTRPKSAKVTRPPTVPGGHVSSSPCVEPAAPAYGSIAQADGDGELVTVLEDVAVDESVRVPVVVSDGADERVDVCVRVEVVDVVDVRLAVGVRVEVVDAVDVRLVVVVRVDVRLVVVVLLEVAVREGAVENVCTQK